jgi:hypothetical protein
MRWHRAVPVRGTAGWSMDRGRGGLRRAPPVPRALTPTRGLASFEARAEGTSCARGDVPAGRWSAEALVLGSGLRGWSRKPATQLSTAPITCTPVRIGGRRRSKRARRDVDTVVADEGPQTRGTRTPSASCVLLRVGGLHRVGVDQVGAARSINARSVWRACCATRRRIRSSARLRRRAWPGARRAVAGRSRRPDRASSVALVVQDAPTIDDGGRGLSQRQGVVAIGMAPLGKPPAQRELGGPRQLVDHERPIEQLRPHGTEGTQRRGQSVGDLIGGFHPAGARG